MITIVYICRVHIQLAIVILFPSKNNIITYFVSNFKNTGKWLGNYVREYLNTRCHCTKKSKDQRLRMKLK